MDFESGNQNPQSTLTSLAILKVNADVAGADYLEYLVPFVTDCLSRHTPHVVRASEVRQYLLNDYGLRVPESTCEGILKRLHQRGALRREDLVYSILSIPDTLEIRRKKANAQEKLRAITASISEFVKEHYKLDYSPQQAEEILIAHLSQISIDCLRSYVQATALPEFPRSDRGELFVVASYLRYIQLHSPELFDAVMVFVKGHMLANALTCPDLENIKEKFGGVTFYFDTPFVTRLLNLEGQYHFEAATELVALLQKLRGQLAIFDHTKEEVEKVLYACESNISNPNARGRVVREARRQSMTASDITLLRSSFVETLASNGVIVRNAPQYDRRYQIDEMMLQSAIQEEIDYWNEDALRYDVNSIRSIYTLRRGQSPKRLEQSTAVMVTTNGALAKIAFQFGHRWESSREVSTVITAYGLSNIAWLKSPLDAPNVPRAEFLATCFAALEPDEAYWTKYEREMDKLKLAGKASPDDLAVMRTRRAQEEMIDLTLGSEDALSESTLLDALDRVKSELTREKEQEIDEVKKQLESANDNINQLKESMTKQGATIWLVSSMVGNALGWLTFLLASCIIVWVSIRGVERLIHSPFLVNLVVSILAYAVLAIGLLHLLFGVSVWSLKRLIARRITRLIAAKFGVTDSPFKLNE